MPMFDFPNNNFQFRGLYTIHRVSLTMSPKFMVSQICISEVPFYFRKNYIFDENFHF